MTDFESSEAHGSTKYAIIRGVATALVFAIAGGTLIAQGNAAAGFGLTMFIVLPGASGLVTAFTIPYWKAVGICLSIAATICLAGLVLTGIEGLVCVVMALPLLFVSAMLGAGLGLFARHYVANRASMTMVPLLAGTAVFGSGQLEDQFHADSRRETVVSTIVIDARPADVWKEIARFDEVTGTRPLLMRMGLPVPKSCSMSGSGVGAVRICKFDSGSIRERVTRWEAPRRLDLTVEEVALPGRHWLGFESASYTLDEIEPGRTRVTRTTTLTSILRPAFYWRVFEGIGTQTEHKYILDCLKSKCDVPE